MEIVSSKSPFVSSKSPFVSSKYPFVSSKSPVLGLGQVRLGHEFVWDSLADRRSSYLGGALLKYYCVRRWDFYPLQNVKNVNTILRCFRLAPSSANIISQQC